MKNSILSIIFLLSVITSCASCDKDSTVPDTIDEESKQDSLVKNLNNHMKIKIGSSTFNATLYENATATAFKAKLPMTINMKELNGNEKFFDLPSNLPAKASNPGTIQAGDLMLYGSNTLVLFYQSFSTPYNYTRIGRIDHPSGLAAALGSGNITIKFELE